ncbi:MAG: SGNH/GDSL hydrolase family protein [Verrucomicrobia bacterium]|nr:SGNH/GDSL hydrolase family protein [Verrucomicrobiota bacterium]
MRIATFTALALVTSILSSFGQPKQIAPRDANQPAAKDPAFEPVTDDPRLPRVLLIGDSISICYTVPVRTLLKGKANVHSIPDIGGPTTNGLVNLRQWLGDSKWDVIHFNWGLHDLRIMPDGERQVAPEVYEKNLRELVRQLKATGAKLIWASTTPVPQPEEKLGVKRRSADVPVYNTIAKNVMDENQIAIDDLYSFALPRLAEIQLPVNVHFNPEGSVVLAKSVTAIIESVLPGKSQ